MADELENALHPNEEGTGKAGATTSDKVKQRREAKIAIAVGIVGAVIAWLAYKRQATSSTSSNPGANPSVSAGTAAPSGGYVAGYQGSGGNGAALGDISNALQGIEGQLSALSPSAVAGSGTGAGAGEATGAAGTPGSAGPQAVNIGGQDYLQLGSVAGPAAGGGFNYSGYNVGGGSAVYYGSPTSGVETGTVKPDTFAYTPLSDQPFVSAAPTTTGEVIGR